jgi:ABC-type lipoprotein export system ATPase subunit
VLSLRGLDHRYPQGTRLTFPDFDAEDATTVLMCGPSGSGKSTLIALAAGLLDVQQGSLRLAGVELAGMTGVARDAWRAARLGVVPQRLHVSESLTVRDNLALSYVSAGLPVDTSRVSELLAALGLVALATRKPHTLSVGQLQRVALARALLRRPSVLLVDEPTAYLDDRAARSAIELLLEQARHANTRLLVATHDPRVLHALPDASVLTLPTATSDMA